MIPFFRLKLFGIIFQHLLLHFLFIIYLHFTLKNKLQRFINVFIYESFLFCFPFLQSFLQLKIGMRKNDNLRFILLQSRQWMLRKVFIVLLNFHFIYEIFVNFYFSFFVILIMYSFLHRKVHLFHCFAIITCNQFFMILQTGCNNHLFHLKLKFFVFVNYCLVENVDELLVRMLCCCYFFHLFIL